MPTDRYLEPHQARQRPPTPFEDLLGDALERAFTEGAHQLPEVVGCLNRTGPAAPNGQPWTEDNLQALLARLGREGDTA
jgi:hypothetical protein